MDRLTAYVAGVVSTLAIAAVALGTIAAVAASPTRPAASHAIAAEFDVEVSGFTEATNPCGSPTSMGCYIADQAPNVIYIREGLGALTDSVILHELGHVMQKRLGLPYDECGAEEFARSLGAKPIYPTCE